MPLLANILIIELCVHLVHHNNIATIFNSMTHTSQLSASETQKLLNILQSRFEAYMHRHAHVTWSTVESKLKKHPDKLVSLYAMEQTGGEPDVVVFDKKEKNYIFVDCSQESPSGRRSLCYDRAAHNARKEHKPKDTAIDVADALGIELLTEEQYRALQTIDTFDLKTSSWVLTPATIRKLGGALFCDRRYDTVFTYHNGAESYYAARGFRGALTV